jgi:hypothetical protein
MLHMLLSPQPLLLTVPLAVVCAIVLHLIERRFIR